MRIAFSCEDNRGLEAKMNAHFGHSSFFTLVDVDDGQVKNVEVLANPFAQGHQPGQIPEFIHSQKAEIMITGGMGARAVQFFTQAGVEPVTGAQGMVKEALEQYLKGNLRGASGCSESHEHGHDDHHH